MDSKPLSTNVKHPSHIKVGDYKVDFHTGCSVIDVTFQNVFYVEIQEIHFKNYYAASLCMLAKQKDTSSEGGEPKWRVAVKDYQMMPNPHCDPGSEGFFTIHQKQLLFPLNNILGVRFVLRQPSPIWKEFKIEDIRIYKAPFQASKGLTLPSWLAEATSKDAEDDEEEDYDCQLKNHGVTSVNSLSQDLQSMWALVEQARSNQTRTSLGRYDIDGSYEINLLSYT